MNYKIVKRGGMLLLLAGLAGATTFLPLADWISGAHAWAAQHRIAAPLLYLAFISLATVLFLPGSVAIMISGYLFGLLPGLLIATVTIPIAAQCAFAVGRWLARDWVRKLTQQRPSLRAIEAGLRSEAFLIVFLTRLSLIIPFNMLNYVYGASFVRARTHLLATLVGMLPAIGLFVYVGTLAHNVGQVLSGEASPPELGYWILFIGLVVITFTIWVIQRAARHALMKHVVGFEQDVQAESEARN